MQNSLLRFKKFMITYQFTTENFIPFFGQFWDNSGTTLRQLLNNNEPIFWTNFTLHEDNLETTLGYIYWQTFGTQSLPLKIYLRFFSIKLVRKFFVSFVSIYLTMWSLKMFIVVCCTFLKIVSSPINSAKNGLRAVKFGNRTNGP